MQYALEKKMISIRDRRVNDYSRLDENAPVSNGQDIGNGISRVNK